MPELNQNTKNKIENRTEIMERQKPHLGLTWQKRPSPPGAEWSSSSCQEDRQVRGERADDALPPPASAARPRPLQTCHGDAPQPLASPPHSLLSPSPSAPSPEHTRAELVVADANYRGHCPSRASPMGPEEPPSPSASSTPTHSTAGAL